MLFKLKTIMECECCGDCKEVITGVDTDGPFSMGVLRLLYEDLQDTYGVKYFKYDGDRESEIKATYVCDDCMMKIPYDEEI